MHKTIAFLVLGVCTFFSIPGCQKATTPSEFPVTHFHSQKIEDLTGIHNLHRLSDSLYTGSSPEGEAGFQSLVQLGVKTVVTVDGAAPDTELARKHGLRYVHLPIGYDGVPRETALQIAAVIRDLPTPVYVHCHHGKHRGPAAAASALRCLDDTCTDSAVTQFLQAAGTDPKYAGLYASVSKAQVATEQEWRQVSRAFPEVASVPGLVKQMVAIDEIWDRLKAVKSHDRQGPTLPPRDPHHDAVLLSEHFREAARLPESVKRDADFREAMASSIRLASELEKALSPINTDAATRIQRDLGTLCVRCHQRHRDNS